MTLDTAKLTTRSNSDLCFIDLIASDVTMSPEARMELIAAAGRDWDRATTGTPARHKARKAAARKWPAHAAIYFGQASA